MCWSLKSSFTFFCLGGVLSLDQIRRYSKEKDEFEKKRLFPQIILYLTYTLMELLQFSQLYFGLVDSCDSTSNQVLTLFAHILIWTQPLAHNFWCLRNTLKGKSVFRFCIVVTLICLVLSSISLSFGYFKLFGFNDEGATTNDGNEVFTRNGNGTQSLLFNSPIQNIGSKLCSYQGPNHLYWLFPYHQLWGYTPHWFTWLMVTVLPHFYRVHPPNDWFGSNLVLGIGLFSGWVVSMIVSVSLGVFHENWSYWCLLSVPYLTLPYVYRILNLPWPKSFNANEELYLQQKKLKKH
ncbi:hypothetical protein ABK040_000003 [Willaertia magna]